MTDRRSFLLAAASASVGAAFTRGALASDSGDPLRKLIVVNSLGDLEDMYGPRPPGLTEVISDRAIKEGLASGLTAVNVTLSAGTDFEETIAAIAKYDDFVRRRSSQLTKVHSVADIRRAKEQNKIGLIYGFQNAAMIGKRLERIDIFADMGVRVIQLTYNALNQIGGGSIAPANPGLSAFGHQVVQRLNARRVIVDLSHSGTQLCLDAARASQSPISISHTGCRALVDLPRNKTDEELRLVAERGGYVGIYFIMLLAKGRPATSDDVVAHIDHAIKICGEDHVGIGTDYGIVPLGDMASQRAFWANFVKERQAAGRAAPGEDPNILPYTEDLVGPTMFRDLHRKLVAKGYSSGRIEKVLGQNFLRFAASVWGE
jgi:membrane dipeptidase